MKGETVGRPEAEVWEELSRTDSDLNNVSKEQLRKLCVMLQEKETVLHAITGGLIEDGDRFDILVCITPLRILSAKKHSGMFFKDNASITSIHWRDVQDCVLERSWGVLAINKYGQQGAIRVGPKQREREKFANIIEQMLVEVKAPSTSAPAQSGNLLDELERLAKLYQSGALTPDEFAAAKRKLLA